ncbi:hypothetical protein [Pectobacterium parmentieri]|uniref:hypothetical protein n=1 Tax=Pectobacterium parmentieri TaxID=1905730 RepID=UPI001E354D6E|nr:hypothetical protein [Pectobacterium parmentieri]
MTTIPLPFITALLLVILFLRIQLLHIQNKETERRNTKAEAIFIGVSCIALALVALRWGSHFAFPPVYPTRYCCIDSVIAMALPFLPWRESPQCLNAQTAVAFLSPATVLVHPWCRLDSE